MDRNRVIDSRPNLFLVGAPKCGTSSLHAYLRQHPQVFMCVPKEPHYFGADHTRINHRNWTEAEYLSLFAQAGSRKWIGDASTSYLHSEVAAHEIKRFSPDARIVMMFRDPVDVMYAYHATQLWAGLEFISDFETALNAEENRKRGEMLPHNRPGIAEGLWYRNVVRYANQVQRFIDVFGRDRIHVIIYDDFKRDTPGCYRQTLEFLRIDSSFRPAFERVNANRVARSVTLNNFLWNPPKGLQSAVSTVLPRRLRLAVGTALKQANLTVKPRPPMNPELRRRLEAEYAPEIERLSALIGRDLTYWSKDVVSGQSPKVERSC